MHKINHLSQCKHLHQLKMRIKLKMMMMMMMIKRSYLKRRTIVGVSTPGVPGPTSKLSLRVPAQMGRREMEHKGEQ
jgi:hypothetical protein